MKTTNLLFLILSFFSPFYFNSQTTIILAPNRDVSLGYHDNYNTENTNYSDANQFAAFVNNGFSGGLNINRAIFDFDLSIIPSSATILNASLNLYAFNNYDPVTPMSQGHYGNNSCYIKRVTQNWGNSSVTWNNQPQTTNQNQVILPQSQSANQDYISIDISQLIQDYFQNPSNSFGFLLGLENEVLGNNLSFHSTNSPETNKKPLLSITYETCYTNFILFPSKDVALGYHDNYNTENTNYGNAQQNAAFVNNGFSGGINSNRALIGFNLSAFTNPQHLISAKLNLFAFKDYDLSTPMSQGHHGNNSCYLQRVNEIWNECSATWNNQPNSTSTNQVVLNQSTDPNQDYLNIDVTELVKDMILYPNQSDGFILKLIQEEIGNNLSFYSKETSQVNKRPFLEIDYCATANIQVESMPNTQDIILYPNPNQSGFFSILTSIDENLEYKVYDLNDKEIVRSSISNQNQLLDLSNLINGIYIINFSNSKNINFTKKIIISR